MLQSDFHHALHTNYSPTDVEAQKIRDFCVAPEAEIEEMELMISRLESTLSAIRQKRDELRDTVAAHRALLSPIRRLSPELLQNIFTFCLSEFPIMHSTQAPLLLGHICKRWRNIVYNTAGLWSAVHVVVPPPPYAQVRLEALKEWLSRSGDCALSISLYSCGTSADTCAFLDVIIPHSHRWTRIALAVPFSCFEYLDSSLNEENALLPLRSFRFTNSNIYFEPAPPTLFGGSTEGLSILNPLRLLKLCPNIQLVSVSLSSHLSYRDMFQNPMSTSLQDLNVECTAFHHLDQLFTFIRLQQRLRKFRLRSSCNNSIPPSQTLSYITLPELECLDVFLYPSPQQDDPDFSCLHFLDRLVTPKLSQLHLVNMLNVQDTNNSIVRLVTRSACSLQALSLHLAQTDLKPLIPCLQYCHNLTKLTIERCDIELDLSSPTAYHGNDEFLLALGYGHGPVNYCSKLTHLSLMNFSTGLNFRSLLTVVQSRTQSPHECARLQLLDIRRLTFAPPGWSMPSPQLNTPPDFFRSAIAELQKQGLTVLFDEESLKDPINPPPSPWLGMPGPLEEWVHTEI